MLKSFINIISPLAKMDPQLSVALGRLRTAVSSGALDPATARILTKEIFTDKMTGMGNAKAYQDFLSRPHKGIHVRTDMNDFGSINKMHGFEIGNQAIVAGMNALKQAAKESGAKAKSFRIGGDEGHFFFPNTESAFRFSRLARNKLSDLPPIKGTHNYSASIGIGVNPEEAEKSLMHAKQEKKIYELFFRAISNPYS